VSDLGREHRSFRQIGTADLQRLLDLASADRQHFFRRQREWAAIYESRILATALCQGAAEHFLRGERGINDFDVYTFYETDPRRRWCAKRRKVADFGDPKFGRSSDRPEFRGRRVDLFGRAIKRLPDEPPIESIRNWLRMARGQTTPWFLARTAVILLEPELGQVAWPEVL
jgi:hypothetical protein